MKVPLILVLVGSVINLLLLGLGIVTAFFLRLVFPSIEWGTAVLTGLVSSASSICALCGILIVASRLEAGTSAREDPEGPPEKEEQPSKLEYRRAWYLPSVDLPTRPTRRRSR